MDNVLLCTQMMNSTLKVEVETFRLWASDYPQDTRSGEWECDYEEWSSLSLAFLSFIENNDPSELTKTEIADLIYVIARDNEIEELIEAVVQNEELFKLLLSNVLHSTEFDAKWQFAVALGQNTFNPTIAEDALLKLVKDTDEYTSRRALQSLGKIGSSHTENLCIKAWEKNQEYQRIMALWVLKEIESKELTKYLELALIDGRKYVVHNANEIKNA